MKNNNLIVFATYWNEIDWVETSLSQIALMDPIEVIICDGCFDEKYPPYSTDGTREIILDFVNKYQKARIISPVRMNRIKHFINWLRPLPHENKIFTLFAKIELLKKIINNNIYRLNQAATFNYMIEISKYFKVGNWVMTYDCDQFYSDIMIEKFRNINYLKDNIKILTGKEYTFFKDLYNYTDNYEQRDYNNFPHKITDTFRYIPTRLPVIAKNFRYYVYSSILSPDNKCFLGTYYHYKFKNIDRINLAYKLGNRQPPKKNFIIKEFLGAHPSIIKRRVEVEF
jgi:hypothetical protein